MNPTDPSVLKRKNQIRELLNQGYPVSQVAKDVGISRKRVYDLAHRDNLPFNSPVKRGGNVERKILEAHAAGYSLSEVGTMFRMSPIFIQSVLNRFRNSDAT